MKKMTTLLLVASLTTALTVSLTACSENPSSTSRQSDVQSQSTVSDVSPHGSVVQTANPWIACEDMAEAVEKAGFDWKIPLDKPTAISVIPGEMIEVSYTHDAPDGTLETVVLRRSPGEGDISGDYTPYAETGTLNIGEVEIQTRKEDDRIYVAYFTAFDGSYSVSCTTGMTEDQVTSIMTQLLELNAK